LETNQDSDQSNLEGREQKWSLTKERILMMAGLAVIFYTIGVVPFLHQQFHPEYLLAGVALCGVSIAQWGDRKK
jgi:cytochrome c biogenesis protein CcdA